MQRAEILKQNSRVITLDPQPPCDVRAVVKVMAVFSYSCSIRRCSMLHVRVISLWFDNHKFIFNLSYYIFYYIIEHPKRTLYESE